MEFAINMSISETTQFALFELNGGYMPSMIQEIRADTAIPKGIQQFAHQAPENLAAAHDAIIGACVFQIHLANSCCRPDPKLEKGALVYLLMKTSTYQKVEQGNSALSGLGHIEFWRPIVRPPTMCWSCQWHSRNKRYILSSMCLCCAPIRPATMLCSPTEQCQSLMTLVPQTIKNGLSMTW
ncbi:hypothetical protein J132_03690 [Termitomyces sp. J132]|nr:hypothetical protein J132_03690 [Termitomyces sp. J132]